MRIRTRAFLLGMLPALLLATLLVGYLSAIRLADLESTLRHRGLTLASYIAESAQYAVISGNLAALDPLVERTKKEADVVYMSIYRGDGNPVLTFGAFPPDMVLPLRQGVVDTPTHIAFSVPVEIHASLPDDPYLPEVRESRRLIAWVQVVMSRAGNEKVARDMLVNSLLLVGLGLIFTVLLVRGLALTGIKPLMEIIQAVRRIGEGDLSGRLYTNAKSELRSLQVGINQMSEALASNQQEMLRRIEDATAELTRQKEAAEQANLAKSKFLAAASHDLRQPLYALGLFSATLKEMVSAPEQSALVEKIEASIHALEEMFNTLLDLSRLEAGSLQPQRRCFALQQVFARVARDHALQAEEKGLRLVVRSTPFCVCTDPLLLQRILSNLVGNALRYTPSGGILIAARQRYGEVSVEVWDSGIGIDAAHLPLIFEEYFQVGNAARDRRQGLGLGLNIVKRLCDLLQHRMDVRSRPGHGSVFKVRMPFGDPDESERRHGREREWGDFARKTVVVIEDDADGREALGGLLSNWGLEVVLAENAGQALAALTTGVAPDLVISDFRLAGDENGIDCITRLRQVWGMDLPAILISGDTAPESVARMTASGFTLLHKPVRPAWLRVTLQNLLRQGNTDSQQHVG